ncbi:MAG: hypothetical protein JJ866_18635, partial [Roseibium sp.]|nr:hypothetical protein [Roseibium sp.]
DDFLNGGTGDDILDVGAGNGSWQHPRGGGGNDTYLIGKNSGNIVVHEGANAGTDTLQFKDLVLSDLAFSYVDTSDYGRALLLSWNKDGDSGKVQVSNEGNDIERFEFADGSAFERMVVRDDGRFELYGSQDQNDYILGTDSDDFILGGSGNDIIDVGAGVGSWQHARGEAGDDTYLIGSDASNVAIQRTGEDTNGGFDTLRFKDLALSDMTLSTAQISGQGTALYFNWNKNGQAGQLMLADLGTHLERFEFADGNSLASISVQPGGSLDLVGTSHDDRITGTAAIDVLTGGSGSDTFVFTDQSGNDHVTDFTNGEDLIHIESGATTFTDLVLEASGANALVKFGGTTITLEGVQVTSLDQGDFLFG